MVRVWRWIKSTALIGATFKMMIVATGSGSAYVFIFDNNGWHQQAKLTPSDGATADQFGFSLALDQETALIGAYRR